jgi:hypothetical protein
LAKPTPTAFLHAFRADGTISSICRQCHKTIATKPSEIDLQKPEETHTCLDFNLGGIFYPGDTNAAKD